MDAGRWPGSFGLSSARPDPSLSVPRRDDLTSLARVASRRSGVYAVQISRRASRVDEAVREAITIGQEAKLPVVIHRTCR